ncbi:MAG: fasciclin domain-containing protein [Bacteroidia bacterium]
MKTPTMLKTLLVLFMTTAGLSLNAQSIYDVISSSTDHSILKSAIDSEPTVKAVLENSMLELTVFAPTNDAFQELADSFDITTNDLLTLPGLDSVLLYHALMGETKSTDIENGDIYTPANDINTIKMTVTSDDKVYANHALVNSADLDASNGVVHSISSVILPVETVIDVALDNNFMVLATAVVTAELMPVLSNPYMNYTVFAPTNDAFSNLATALDVDIEDLLELETLGDLLTHHVLDVDVYSDDVENGLFVTPINDDNTLKITVTSDDKVYINQAQVTGVDVEADNGVVHILDAVLFPDETVVDVAIANGFTTLATAVVEAELLPALTNPLAELTVFAPSNEAFSDLADALDTDIDGILELENLADVLTYHVLGTEVEAEDVTNGAIVSPLSSTNTIKMTKTSMDAVYANQAMVTLADVDGGNGIIHALNAVLLPSKTVVDVAIENEFTTLATAVITAELLPALTNPFAELTVFAPDNAAFSALADALDTDLDGILALDNLADVLTYHVLGSEVNAAAVTNGAIVDALSTSNTIKMTKTSEGKVFANHAEVTTADVDADNGIVHVINSVILPNKTVVDVAIENNFTTLTAAVTVAELLPALSNPLASFTVFAPTNDAFADLAEALEVEVTDLLTLDNLSEILLYHVVSGTVTSDMLENGSVETLQGRNIIVDISNGVVINESNVDLADVAAENGVVHVIDAVLDVDFTTSIVGPSVVESSVYPSPATDFIMINSVENGTYEIMSLSGQITDYGVLANTNTIDVSGLENGVYFVKIQSDSNSSIARFIKE